MIAIKKEDIETFILNYEGDNKYSFTYNGYILRYNKCGRICTSYFN